MSTYNIARPVDAKQIRYRQVQAHSMPASLSQHALGKTSGAARVDDVDGIIRLDRHTLRPLVPSASALDQMLPLPLAFQLAGGPPKVLFALPAKQ